MWYISLWLWRWLQHRLSKRQSLSTITVLFRTTFTRLKAFWIRTNTRKCERQKQYFKIWRNHRVLIIMNVRVNYCALWDWKRVRTHVIRSKQGHIVRFVQCFYYPRTVNSVSILFSWHKNFRELWSGIMFCQEEKLVTVRQKANWSEFLTQITDYGKKSVFDRFIYLHCLKCVPMKATYVTKCKGFFLLC